MNTEHFTQEYSDEELRVVRQQLGGEEGDTLLVTTSRLVYKNAIDDVIRAMTLLPKQVKFIIFGIGPDEETLKALANEQGVSDRVQFRGQIGHAEMPKYLKACDIFIRPSRSEGMGNSFVEAMAAELPVIATQEGGIVDFLFDAELNPDTPATGFAVRKDNPEDIKNAVLRILEDKEATAATIARAKAMAIQKYDWNLIAGRMEEEVFAPLFKKE